MTNAIAQQTSRAVARPLSLLVPLIKQDFDDAEGAGLPYYRKAGEKLQEARCHEWKDAAEFWNWAISAFGKSKSQLSDYMSLARATASGKFALRPPNNLSNALGEKTQAQRFREQSSPAGVAQAKIAAFNFDRFNQEQADKQIERDLVRKLCLEIIDIGFKVLATKMHPDKAGGSDEAFKRLKTARDSLKERL